jgi:hypothetical protein
MSETEKRKETKKGVLIVPETGDVREAEVHYEEEKKAGPAPCPVLPSSVEKILATLDQLDKGEIDEFDAVQQVTGVMKEHRKTKLEALRKLESTEQEEETETATE